MPMILLAIFIIILINYVYMPFQWIRFPGVAKQRTPENRSQFWFCEFKESICFLKQTGQ